MTDEDYAYDENGNRTDDIANIHGADQDYETGTNNQLLFDGTYRYAYDGEGNRIARWNDNGDGVLGANDTAITEYAWDHRNRLVGITERAIFGGPATLTAEHRYDAANRHVAMEIDPDGAGSDPVEQTFFLYEQGQIALQFDKVGASSVGAGDLSHRYLWGSAVDMLLADEQIAPGGASETLWALTDHLGSVRDLVDDDGVVQMHRQFDAFGNIVGQTGVATTAFAFTGKLFEIHTGLQQSWHRWYDPRSGRWTSEDPIGFAAGDANLGRYVANESTQLADPLGLWQDEHLPGKRPPRPAVGAQPILPSDSWAEHAGSVIRASEVDFWAQLPAEMRQAHPKAALFASPYYVAFGSDRLPDWMQNSSSEGCIDQEHASFTAISPREAYESQLRWKVIHGELMTGGERADWERFQLADMTKTELAFHLLQVAGSFAGAPAPGVPYPGMPSTACR